VQAASGRGRKQVTELCQPRASRLLILFRGTLEVFWISGRCVHPGDNINTFVINKNKSPKDESFVSVREEFVRPLGGRHSREARVRARFRRMRIVFELRSYY